MNRLFVYGIFLDEANRLAYGMTNPRYTTVLDYATFGGGIVRAKKIDKCGLSLTGLIVDIDPNQWDRLDALEYGYDRITVTTTNNETAYMYAAKEK